MPITHYLNQIQENLNTGNAKEHTHRSALEMLIETLAPQVNAVNEPRRIACGAPDYVVLNKKNNVPLGYIEAKDIGISLDKTQKTEQLTRYLDSLNNLILTDYLEFRWFVEGELKPEMTVCLAKINKKGVLIPCPEQFTAFENLLDTFLHTHVLTLKNPTDLAQRLAKIAQLIKYLILKAYQQEKQGTLHEQLDSFRYVLLDDLTAEQFADMYAQTICYGLFAARCHTPLKDFSRNDAAYQLPKTNPFLRQLFDHIAGINLDDRLVWAVDHVVDILNRADIAAILADFGQKTCQEDPVVHFYETFLAHYDPKMRESRGVYYTPEPVVSYIVRSVDLLLKQNFKLKKGLADSSKIDNVHKVQILDPAVGTGTFLYTLFDHIYQNFQRNKGMWSDYVRQHLLPRVHGFELLMAPYTIAHLKLGLSLQEKGYDFQSDERLRIFLTNTLDEAHTSLQHTMMAQWLSQEANAAKSVKTDMPVMVIMGNPPYSGHSANTGDWIKGLLRGEEGGANYFEVDSKPLGERNPKWLNDDYVKFIRFAHWRIMQTGYGILAFVTNHGYLDNPTFRGMRQSLMQDFDDIYILDLHGNSKKKEKSPDGTPDKNVFDIQQGVAIGIFVKHNKKTPSTVYHADIWGTRAQKYEQLMAQDVKKTAWTVLKPQSPFYLFIPQNLEFLKEYEQGWKITDIMPVNGVGMTTARDDFVIDKNKDRLLQRIRAFKNANMTDNELHQQFNIRIKKGWNIRKAWTMLQDVEEATFEQCVKNVLYRPFDERYIYYHDAIVWRTVKRVMQHLLAGDNLGLISVRKTPPNQECGYFLVTNHIISNGVIRADNQSIDSLFPLYLYATQTDECVNGNGTHHPKPTKTPNFTPKFIKDIENHLKLTFIPDGKGNFKKNIGPEDIFYYMYAIFHSPTYRQRYAEFLKIDFPRLPLTNNKKCFQKLSILGEKLAIIHLMENDEIACNSGFPIEGDNQIEKITYQHERIYINKTQYFDNVTADIWNFHIGGYQVCQKWLKDRKGQPLTFEMCEHYLYIIAALEHTIQLMNEIDRCWLEMCNVVS